jgi:Transposase DDE domain group 1
VAETTLGEDRLIVRRTRLTGSQASLWPDWRYHAFVTDRAGSAVELDTDHRHHAVCELAIRDLKDGAGLRHCPAGRFLANPAWLVLGALAHNLLRWTATIGLGACGQLVAKTFRRRLLALPGRLTRSAAAVSCICRATGHGQPVPASPDPATGGANTRLTASQPHHRTGCAPACPEFSRRPTVTASKTHRTPRVGPTCHPARHDRPGEPPQRSPRPEPKRPRWIQA